MLPRALVALAVAVPVLRTRGIYLALATFALGEIVRASILNLEVVGGAAGYPVTAFIRLPTIAMFALGVTVLGLAVVCDPLRHRDHRGPRRRARRRPDGPRRACVPGRRLHARFDHRRHRRRSLCASFQLHRGAIFYDLSVDHRSCFMSCSAARRAVLGPLLGAAVFTLLPELLRGSANGATCCLPRSLIVVMVIRPQGLVTGAQIRRLLGLRSGASRNGAAA